MSPIQRDEKYQIRLTTEERQMLEAIAEYRGLSASDMVRQFIRNEYSEVHAALELAAKERAMLKPTEFARHLDKMVRPMRAIEKLAAPAFAKNVTGFADELGRQVRAPAERVKKNLGAAAVETIDRQRAATRSITKHLPRSRKKR